MSLNVARKAEVFAWTSLAVWLGKYAWGWLAGLSAIPIGVRLIFITPNDPAPEPWQPPARR